MFVPRSTHSAAELLPRENALNFALLTTQFCNRCLANGCAGTGKQHENSVQQHLLRELLRVVARHAPSPLRNAPTAGMLTTCSD
jgi:hypothetical protein